MDNQKIINELKEYFIQYYKSCKEFRLNLRSKKAEDLPLKIEETFEKYLANEPNDLEMWMKFGLFLFQPPLADSIKCIECVDRVLKIDPNNIRALLLKAAFESFTVGETGQKTFECLSKIMTTDPELNSMIELAKAWYYQFSDKIEYENCLKQSIEFSDKHVNNYNYLSEAYLRRGLIVEARSFARRALNNVTHIYTDYELEDLPDIEEFFAYYYKGIHQTSINYKSLQKDAGISGIATFFPN